MTSSTTTYSTLGDPSYGGALFTLPREVRDEIYRFVFRKRYIMYITRPGSDDPVPSTGKHELAILQVSKAINHEASDILYADSVFRFSMNFNLFKVSSAPAHLANRMTNVELDLKSYSHYCEHTDSTFYAATAGFANTNIRRNHLHIRFFECRPLVVTRLLTHLSKALNACISFRTVHVEVVSVCPRYLEGREELFMDLFGFFGDPQKIQKETTITIGQQILDILTPTLGPAETTVRGDVNCYIWHPQDYLARSA
ncbi:hypothetical protein BDR22DRAFT_824094 [Usnea florida]